MSSKGRDVDFAFLQQMRTLGILENVCTNTLNTRIRGGVQMVCCADSDQFSEIYEAHKMLGGCSRCAPLNHYGGATVIPAHSPASALGQSENVLEQLFLGHALGKGSSQVQLSHYPCSVAAGYNIPPQMSFQLLCDAREATTKFFKTRLKSIKVYVAALDKLGTDADIEEICMESKLSRREVLAIQRIEKCSSHEHLREIRMVRKEHILSQYHVHWPDGRKRTYHLNRKKFREWLKKSDARLSAAA